MMVHELIGIGRTPSSAVHPELHTARPEKGHITRDISQAPETGVGGRTGTYAQKLMQNESLRREAVIARHTDAILKKLKEILLSMRENLATIVKNYPPFPPGGAERLAYLNSVAGLRRQIEALTIPPRVEQAEYNLPSDLTAAPQRLPSGVLNQLPIFEGQLVLPQSLDPASATDVEIVSAVSQTDQALAQIDAYLSQLSANVQALADRIQTRLANEGLVKSETLDVKVQLTRTPTGLSNGRQDILSNV
jgi:hypothetical protein